MMIESPWFVVGGIIILLSAMVMNEIVILRRPARSEHESVIHYFTILILLIISGVVIYGGYYIESRQKMLENIMSIPPGVRYAVERNSLPHRDMWVYTTQEDEETIRIFYREYATLRDIQYIEDGMRMSFGFPSGNIFLTIVKGDNATVLYFSREGEIRSVPTK